MEQEGVAGEGTGSAKWGGGGIAESEDSSREGAQRQGSHERLGGHVRTG